MSDQKRDYASTQIVLPKVLAAALRTLSRKIAKADLAEDGREDDPHITVKYGLEDDSPVNVRRVLKEHGPISVTLGKTSIFPDSGNGDVVKVDVDSKDLHAVHEALNALPHGDSHAEYQPHATVAYVKAGKGKQYEGLDDLDGQTFTADTVEFCRKDSSKCRIPL